MYSDDNMFYPMFFFNFTTNDASWSVMVSSIVVLNFASCFACLSPKLASRYLIMFVCVIEGEGKVGIMVTSVEIVMPERTVVDGDIVRNKCWVGLVKLSEGQNIVECCCDLKIINL